MLGMEDFWMSLAFPIIDEMILRRDRIGLEEAEMVSLRIVFSDLMELISGLDYVHAIGRKSIKLFI